MGNRLFISFGIIGSLIAYLAIGLSIGFSSWFSWEKNALSDLGHAQRSSVASIFNFGLLLSGFLIAIYAIKALNIHAKYTSMPLTFSAFMLQAVAAFDEIYGVLHFAVSVLFFITIGVSCLLYAIEKRSALAAAAFAVELLVWILYFGGAYRAGVAVPETISAVAATLVVVRTSLIMLGEKGKTSLQI